MVAPLPPEPATFSIASVVSTSPDGTQGFQRRGPDSACPRQITTAGKASEAFPPEFHLLKLVVGIIVLGATLAESIPARWVASALPEGAGERLVSGYIKSNARLRCGHEGGEEAIRKILVRLDPKLGPSVDIVGINQGGFMVTAMPPKKLLLLRDALTAVDADALAALIAHELSHIRHGDAAAAVVRYEGNVATIFALLEGEAPPPGAAPILRRGGGSRRRRGDRFNEASRNSDR